MGAEMESRLVTSLSSNGGNSGQLNDVLLPTLGDADGGSQTPVPDLPDEPDCAIGTSSPAKKQLKSKSPSRKSSPSRSSSKSSDRRQAAAALAAQALVSSKDKQKAGKKKSSEPGDSEKKT